MSARRAVVLVGVVLACLWALQGGEYGTTDLFRQRRRRAALQAEVDSLQRQVDSLRRYEHAVQTDPALQERIAREEFGMVRGDRELLYRFADTSGAGGGAAALAAPAARSGATP